MNLHVFSWLDFFIHWGWTILKTTELKRTIILDLASRPPVYEEKQISFKQNLFFMSHFSVSSVLSVLHCIKPSLQNCSWESTCLFFLISQLTEFLFLDGPQAISWGERCFGCFCKGWAVCPVYCLFVTQQEGRILLPTKVLGTCSQMKAFTQFQLFESRKY